MSNISKASKELKKKLSFDDYDTPVSKQDSQTASQHTSKPVKKQVVKSIDKHNSKTANQHASKPVNELTVMPVKEQASIPGSKHSDVPANQHTGKATRKSKATFYLTGEANTELTQVYIKYLQANQKIDKSALICEAIRLLYKQEM